MDRLSEMEAFVHVVLGGGFTEAAKRLNLSKSAVSKSVAALEGRLGARLINRTTRRINPTEIGLAYFERCQQILQDVAAADAIAAHLQGAPRGDLRISAPLSYGRLRLSPIIGRFCAKYTEVTCHLSLEDRFVDVINEGHDLAVRITNTLPDSSLTVRRIGTTRLRFFGSPAYLAQHGTPQTAHDLHQHKLLHYSLSPAGRVWRVGEQTIRAPGPVVANNGEALLEAAKCGLGLVTLPDFIAESAIAEGSLTEILPQHGEDLGIWILMPPGRFTQPKVRAFVDFLSAEI